MRKSAESTTSSIQAVSMLIMTRIVALVDAYLGLLSAEPDFRRALARVLRLLLRALIQPSPQSAE